MVYALSVAAIYVFVAQSQIGQSARQVSPEVVRQMHQQAAAQENPVSGADLERNRRVDSQKLAALAAQINEVAGQVAEVAKQLEDIRGDLAEKDMSRVSVLEEKLKTAARERAQAEKEDRDSHEELMAWLRPASLTLGTAAILSLLGVIAGFMRGRALVVVKKQLDVVNQQTNGMREKLEEVAHASGYEEGKADERKHREDSGS